MADPDIGDRRRREILGDDYVDASLAAADELTRTFQELVTAQVWAPSLHGADPRRQWPSATGSPSSIGEH